MEHALSAESFSVHQQTLTGKCLDALYKTVVVTLDGHSHAV